MSKQWLLWFALCCPAHVHAQDLPIYDDQLRSGFADYSYGGGSNFANTTPTHAGTASIAFTGNNFNAISFAHETQNFNTASYPRLRVFVHGGASGGQQLRVYVQRDGAIVAQAELDSYISGGGVAANLWRQVDVVFAQAPLSYAGEFDRIDLQSDVAGTQPTLYVDDATLLAAGSSAGDTVLRSGFEDGEGGPLPQPLLLIERDVAVNGMTTDRYTWRDAANTPRVAALAHNTGQTGPNGQRGGELWEYRYETPSGTRTARATNQFAGGFGYVVSHRNEGTTGIAGDDSPLGHGFTGQMTRVFEGRHHAILRFTQLYPRHSRTSVNPPNTRYDVPVTLEWTIINGRDHPLWSMTWDISGVPADALDDDSRAPYGELLFDGSASLAAHSVIAGVGWGDRYKFASTTAPVTLSSQWTWNQPNTVPYVKLWTTDVDATVGTVQTQTITQQDAGGYFGTARWNSTSAGGFACTVFGNNYRMPCDFNWPYQSINYSFGGTNVPTNNTRLAWGTNFGWLGRTSYATHGSSFWGGPGPDGLASGWPRKSYSTFIVLGLHSAAPVEAQVGEIETVQATTASAAIGSVRTNGPAGINRADTVNYAPAGWNHVRAAWAFNAAGNALDANLAVGAGTLRRPLIIVSNWTSATLPSAVRLQGATLTQDADYLPSLRADAQELWITVLRDFSGPNNRLEIAP